MKIQMLIQIVLLCFVTPSYQIVNENIKSKADNALANKVKNLQNAQKIVNLATRGQKVPVKTLPSHITPQPLISKRKIVINPVESANIHNALKNKKPVSVKASNQNKPKPECVSQPHEPDLKSETKEAKEEENQLFSEEIENLCNKTENYNSCTTKEKTYQNNEDDEASLKLNTEKEPESKAIEKDVKLMLEEVKTKEIKDTVNKHIDKIEPQQESICQSSSKEDKSNEVLNNVYKNNNMTLNETKKNFENKTNNQPSLEKVLKLKILNNNVSNDKSSNAPKLNNNQEITKKQFLCSDETSDIDKLEIQVDPRPSMKKLTNDADDNIYIKNHDFEEVFEKYDNDFEAGDTNVQNNKINTPDTKNIKKPNKNTHENHNVDNHHTHRHYTGDLNKALKERIWRTWNDYEIHINSGNKDKLKKSDYHKLINDEATDKDELDYRSDVNLKPVDDNTYKAQDGWQSNAANEDKAKIRYYSPDQYMPLSDLMPDCYQPKSYGNQYSPVSSYRKYLFPCM